MQQRVSCQELHGFALQEPMRTLAKRFGISEMALAKTYRQTHVPTPPKLLEKNGGRYVPTATVAPHVRSASSNRGQIAQVDQPNL